jgi:hypothetical protein
MKLDTLDTLNDSELQAVIARSEELLKSRDDERKAKALNDARTLLASVGLSLKDLGAKCKSARPKPPTYQGGHHYRHPSKPELIWNAKGQKPGWLRDLETRGVEAVEIAVNDKLAAVAALDRTATQLAHEECKDR